MTNAIEITRELLDRYVANYAKGFPKYYYQDYSESKRIDGYEGTFGEYLYEYGDEYILMGITAFANGTLNN